MSHAARRPDPTPPRQPGSSPLPVRVASSPQSRAHRAGGVRRLRLRAPAESVAIVQCESNPGRGFGARSSSNSIAGSVGPPLPLLPRRSSDRRRFHPVVALLRFAHCVSLGAPIASTPSPRYVPLPMFFTVGEAPFTPSAVGGAASPARRSRTPTPRRPRTTGAASPVGQRTSS